MGALQGLQGPHHCLQGVPKALKLYSLLSWGVLGGPGGSGLVLGALIGSGWLRLALAAGLRAVAAILALAGKLGVDFGVDFSVPGCAGLDCSCGGRCGGNRWWW